MSWVISILLIPCEGKAAFVRRACREAESKRGSRRRLTGQASMLLRCMAAAVAHFSGMRINVQHFLFLVCLNE